MIAGRCTYVSFSPREINTEKNAGGQCRRPVRETSAGSHCGRPVRKTVAADQCGRPVLGDQCGRPVLGDQCWESSAGDQSGRLWNLQICIMSYVGTSRNPKSALHTVFLAPWLRNSIAGSKARAFGIKLESGNRARAKKLLPVPAVGQGLDLRAREAAACRGRCLWDSDGLGVLSNKPKST